MAGAEPSLPRWSDLASTRTAAERPGSTAVSKPGDELRRRRRGRVNEPARSMRAESLLRGRGRWQVLQRRSRKGARNRKRVLRGRAGQPSTPGGGALRIGDDDAVSVGWCVGRVEALTPRSVTFPFTAGGGGVPAAGERLRRLQSRHRVFGPVEDVSGLVLIVIPMDVDVLGRFRDGRQRNRQTPMRRRGGDVGKRAPAGRRRRSSTCGGRPHNGRDRMSWRVRRRRYGGTAWRCRW